MPASLMRTLFPLHSLLSEGRNESVLTVLPLLPSPRKAAVSIRHVHGLTKTETHTIAPLALIKDTLSPLLGSESPP